MRYVSNFWRVLRINWIVARYGLDRILFSSPYFYSLRFLQFLNPWNWGYSQRFTRGEAIRLALEQLGPLFVKFGQMLSTRRDLLPDDIANELTKLQDQVPPFDGKIAQAVAEKVYRKPLTQIFQQFDVTPLASASIAQVHAAVLLTGEKVVVKILRPRVRKQVMRDIDVLYSFARGIEKLWRATRRLKLTVVIKEFEHTTLNELDLLREAANAAQLRRNFPYSDLLYVPTVYWDYTRKNILVMERIEGVPIDDLATLKQQQVNLKVLAEKGVEIFFTQVFRDSFFHADIHAGNIFIETKEMTKARTLNAPTEL